MIKKTILLILPLFFISCSTPEHYKVTGVIKLINDNERKFLIDHEEIPGFMVKMEMFFNVHEQVDLKQFAVNDSVSFDLIIKDKNSYTINYKKIGESKLSSNDDDFFYDEEEEKYKLKEPGDFIDDATFLDINNKEVKLSDFNSKLIAISFIFSKCPMPNMCPASVYKNEYLSKNFSKDDIVFLMISFDYLYDTPLVMKNIYGSQNSDNLIFLSSHKHINDITILSEQAGVGFWGVEDNNIGHTMRTVILDGNLKFLKSFDGMDWVPKDAKRDLENLIKMNQ
tara:strand:+ start:1701 stop:2546 length:846 start_codon:yes stop_codon:yes gene_type:complete